MFDRGYPFHLAPANSAISAILAMSLLQCCARQHLYLRSKASDVRSDRVSKSRQRGVNARLAAVILIMAFLVAIEVKSQEAHRMSDRPFSPVEAYSQRGISHLAPHEALIDGEHIYSLGELIDIAESNSPLTKETWDRAKVAAASVGIAKSELYPTIIATAAGRSYLNPELFGQNFAVQDIGDFDTAVHLAYTLVDFGARRTEISAAKARLFAAQLSFNNEQLVLIRSVCEAYYGLLEAKGLREAAEVSLKDAQASESAARERRINGLATVPEVLEATAATAKANYDLQSAVGAEQVEFGDLARTITVSPLKPMKVEALDRLNVPSRLDHSVQDALETAFKTRPDLQADEVRVKAAHADVKHASSSYYPSLTFNGSKGWLRAFGEQWGSPGVYAQTSTYDATLGLQWTVFDGFRRESLVRQAKAAEKVATDAVHDRQDEIANQVWDAFANATTALQQRQAATAYLTASEESYSAALASYKEGVRNLLDVLAAEETLAKARALDVTARTRVLRSFTELEFRTGGLLADHPKGNTP